MKKSIVLIPLPSLIKNSFVRSLYLSLARSLAHSHTSDTFSVHLSHLIDVSMAIYIRVYGQLFKVILQLMMPIFAACIRPFW